MRPLDVRSWCMVGRRRFDPRPKEPRHVQALRSHEAPTLAKAILGICREVDFCALILPLHRRSYADILLLAASTTRRVKGNAHDASDGVTFEVGRRSEAPSFVSPCRTRAIPYGITFYGGHAPYGSAHSVAGRASRARNRGHRKSAQVRGGLDDYLLFGRPYLHAHRAHRHA